MSNTDDNTPLPTHEDYYNRIRSLAGSATSNLSSGEDEHLSRNVSIVLHNMYLRQAPATNSRNSSSSSASRTVSSRPAPRPDDISLVVGQAEYRREWTMAVVETRPDGAQVLIRGEAKLNRDEVARGLLDVVDVLVWKACNGDGKAGGRDLKRGSG